MDRLKESTKIRRLLDRKIVFPFLAFTIPLLLRAIPEVAMGSYMLGFDTMGHYVPTTLLWLRGNVSSLSFLGTAPLLYSIVASLVFLGGSIVWVIKIISIVLQGFLGLSIYGYAKKGLQWSYMKSTITALLGTLYFVALRVSWDSLRSMLGLAIFFVALTLYSIGEREGFSRKLYALISLSIFAVVLSNQLVSIIMFGVFTLTIIYKLFRKEKTKAIGLVLTCLPAILMFLTLISLLPSVSEFRLIFGFSNTNDGWLALFGFPSYSAMLLSEAGFFFYCFLPLLPFALLGIWSLKNFQVRAWILLSLTLLLVPMVSPSNLRFIILLTYPLAFCVAESVTKIKALKWKRLSFYLHRIGASYLVLMVSVLTLGFMLMPPEEPFHYFAKPFNDYNYQIPTSMLQNTVSKTACDDTIKALQWFSNNSDDNALLLTHRAFYGWAILAANTDKVFLYEYNNPENAALTAFQNGYNKIYLIWWINGEGWYNQPTVPLSFEKVHNNGEIAIYYYKIEA